MKATYLLSCATALALASAYSVPSLSDLQHLIFDENTVEIGDSTDQLPESLLSSIAASRDPNLIDAWKSLLHDAGVDGAAKLYRKYLAKSPVAQTLMNNLYQAFTTPEEPQFESLSSPRFPEYALRIRENDPEVLGLDDSKYYTGYLDVESLGKHFFYWFFESRNDPENDPVVLWLNGGPGCSSATGLFFELGPSSINATLQPVRNPYSWNNNASVIFLDQPVGVGYSYTDGEAISSTAAAAKDVFTFLELFFQKFPHLTSQKFHIAGESYAGHYIPSFASEIINRADRSFDLASVLIGNGITDPLVQSKYYRPMACGEGGYKPVLSPETCDQMDKDYGKCEKLAKLCYKFQTALTCVPANYYCDAKLFGPYQDTGLNPYDIRVLCNDPAGSCYKEMDYIDDYLNLDYVKAAVGASNIDIFTSCDDTVFNNFIKSGDEMKPFQGFVAELLNKEIPVLLYEGDKDFICNWLGNHAWANMLDYKEKHEFQSKPLIPWHTLEGKLAGEVQNHGIFTFLRIYEAGHMVPFNQPEASLDMLNRWLSGDYALTK